MMRDSATCAAFGVLLAVAMAGAQTAGQTQPPATQTPQTPATTTVQPTTRLVGCLYREDQVLGRTPTVTEKAGILEDYILAEASLANPEGQPGASTGTSGTASTSATPASGNMYKVEGPSDEQLKALVGKRVEVTGRIEPAGGATDTRGNARPDLGPGPDQIRLPELEASSIREVSGSCPAKPGLPK